MKNKPPYKARSNDDAAKHGGKRGGNRPASALTADLRDALQGLDDAAGDLRAALRRSDSSARGRLALAADRRAAAERLVAIFQAVAPVMVECEYLEPGIVDRFHEVWVDLLGFDPRQGEATLLAFMGRVRQLMLDAIGADDPAGAGAGKVDRHAAESGASVQSPGPDGPPKRHVKADNGQVQGRSHTATAKRLYSVEEAADFLGRTKEAVQHLIASGKIPTVRSDRRVFLDREDLERWIQSGKV